MDQSTAAHVIETQFPVLAPVRAAFLGAGCDSDAFDVNGEWVFRFPRRDDVEQQLLIEMRVLPVLAMGAPVEVPVFSFAGDPTSLFPRRFGGYRKVPGVPAIALEDERTSLSTIAPAVGAFLSWLHAIPIADAIAIGVPSLDWTAQLDEIRADAAADIEVVRKIAPRGAPVDAWRAFLEAGPGPIPDSAPVVGHNDFAAEHVLLDPETRDITGVIDWSDIAVGSPVLDIAGVLHWGGAAFADAVLSAYRGRFDRSLLPAAQYLAACRGAGDVAFGVSAHRPDYVRAGLRALAHTAGV